MHEKKAGPGRVAACARSRPSLFFPPDRPDASLTPLPIFSLSPFSHDRMDWTDVHYRQLARLLSAKAWLYTEMVVDATLLHNPDTDR